MTHPDFVAFYNSIVIAILGQHPGYKRLDGKVTGGSRDSAGQFEYCGKFWTVHMDSHFEPLRIAFDGFQQGKDPFIVKETKKGQSLILAPEYKRIQSTKRKYMYIYTW